MMKIHKQFARQRPGTDESEKEQDIAIESFTKEILPDQCAYVMTSLLYTFNPLTAVQDFSVSDLEAIILSSQGETKTLRILNQIGGNLSGLMLSGVKALFAGKINFSIILVHLNM